MANIVLTYKCNLHCEYCFANEFVNNSYECISIENFKKILNFIIAGNKTRVGLIGWEPTLHPQFREILKILEKEKAIDKVTIFTNGTLIDKYIDAIKHKKFNLLINCNSPAVIGNKYDLMCKNINLIYKKYKNKKFNLGINLHSEDLDYSYILELLKTYKLKTLRFSMTVPNKDKFLEFDTINHCKKMHDIIFELIKDCYSLKVIPNYDCNQFPSCLLTDEDKKLIFSIMDYAKKKKIYTNISRGHRCSPVIDILPSLTAVRCFGLSEYIKVPIQQFRNLRELRNYFFNSIDCYAYNTCISQRCQECKDRYQGSCGLCLAYTINETIKIKDYCMNLTTQSFNNKKASVIKDLNITNI